MSVPPSTVKHYCIVLSHRFCFSFPGYHLAGIVQKENIGVISLSKKNSTGHLFVWFDRLPRDDSHIDVGQVKQMLDMLSIIGAPPVPGDENYVPQDSLMKRMHDVANQQRYSVKRPAASDEKHYINKGNQITRPLQTYYQSVIETLSLQLLANHRGPFSKSNKFTNQSPELTAHLSAIQGGLLNYIDSEVPALARVMFREQTPSQMCTDIPKIFNKRLHINNLIKTGVYTGWTDFRDNPGGIWVGQWFLWTCLTDEHRRTVDNFSTTRP